MVRFLVCRFFSMVIRFGTGNWLCMLLKEVCYFSHSPKLGPDWLMLIERLYYYRGCYYTSSTVPKFRKERKERKKIG